MVYLSQLERDTVLVCYERTLFLRESFLLLYCTVVLGVSRAMGPRSGVEVTGVGARDSRR